MLAGRQAEIVREALGIQGWMSPDELNWLASAAASRYSIIEIGSWKGRSTKALALSTKGIVYAVDHWRGSEGERETKQAEALKIDLYSAFESNLRDEIMSGKVVAVRCDSVEAIEILNVLLKDHSPDMIFIDGDHSYDAVRRDIINYSKLLRGRGLLCGHDYAPYWPGVQMAVDELLPGRNVNGHIWYYEP